MAIERTLVILKPDSRLPREAASGKRIYENAAIAEKMFTEAGLKTVGKITIERDDTLPKVELKEFPGQFQEGLRVDSAEMNNQKTTLGTGALTDLYKAFYIEQRFRERNLTQDNYYPKLAEVMAADTSIVLVVEGEGAIEKVREHLGGWRTKDWGKLRREVADPSGGGTNNGVHASDSKDAAWEETRFFQKTVGLKLSPSVVVGSPEVTGHNDQRMMAHE